MCHGIARSLSAIVTLIFSGYLAWPCRFDAEEFSVPEPPTLDGVYHPQHCKADRSGRHMINYGDAVGPESLVFDSAGTLYMGSRYGAIWKLAPGNESPVLLARTGSSDCKPEHSDVPECGRPLGLRMLNATTLVMIDLHAGLLAVDTATGAVRTVLDGDVMAGGRQTDMLNDLDVDTDTQTVYMSQMSVRGWPLSDLDVDIMEGQCTGRLLSYHIPSDKAEVVAEGLCFPNGVQLSADRKYLVVAEMARYRLSQIALVDTELARKGEKIVLDDATPGFPDNLRSHPDGGYLLAIPTLRRKGGQTIEILTRYPTIRKVLYKITPKAFYRLIDLNMQYGICTHYHSNGTVLNTYHFDDFPTFRGVSQCTVAPDNKTLYTVNRLDGRVVMTPLA